MDSLLRLLTAMGTVTGARLWVGSATTDANGDWSIDYTAAGFAEVLYVAPVPLQDAGAVQDLILTAGLRTVSTTGASGTALRGANLAELGPTVRRAPAEVVVQMAVIGRLADI